MKVYLKLIEWRSNHMEQVELKRKKVGNMKDSAQKIKNIPIALPSLGIEELEAIKEPLLNGWLTQGSQVAKFEERI